jgi:hypothetical protein
MSKLPATFLLVCFAIGSPLAIAQGTNVPAQGSSQATEQPRANAGDSRCSAGEPVSIWYLNNPQAAGGLYSNPWADCRPGKGSQ